jgi:hypothetical protein
MGCNKQPVLTAKLELKTDIEEASDIIFLLNQRLKILDSAEFKIEVEGNKAVVNFFNKVDSNKVRFCLLSTIEDGFYKTYDNNVIIPLMFSIGDSIGAINDSIASLKIKQRTDEFYKGLKKESNSLAEKIKNIEGPDTSSTTHHSGVALFLTPLVKRDGLIGCKTAGFMSKSILFKADSIFNPYKKVFPRNFQLVVGSASSISFSEGFERPVYCVDSTKHYQIIGVNLNTISQKDSEGYVFVYNNRVFLSTKELEYIDSFYSDYLWSIDMDEKELDVYLSLINKKYLKVKKVEFPKNIPQ